MLWKKIKQVFHIYDSNNVPISRQKLLKEYYQLRHPFFSHRLQEHMRQNDREFMVNKKEAPLMKKGKRAVVVAVKLQKSLVYTLCESRVHIKRIIFSGYVLKLAYPQRGVEKKPVL